MECANRSNSAVDSGVRVSKGMFSHDGLWAEKASGEMLVLHRIEKGVDGRKILGGTFSPDGTWYALKSKDRDHKNAGQRRGAPPVRIMLSGPPVDEDDELENSDGMPSFDVWMSFSSGSRYLAVSIHSTSGNAIEVVSLPDFITRSCKGSEFTGRSL